jgi:hypothetical protein
MVIEMSIFDEIERRQKAGSVFDMPEQPKRDVVAETREQVFQTVKKRLNPVTYGTLMFFTAETGLGKTTGAQLAMKRVWREMHPSFSFLVMVPTKKDADIFWREMEALESGCAGVWTQTHDPELQEPASFTPSVLFTKHEAAKKRCLILTHNAGKAAEDWVGRRDAVLIDEYPQPVPTGFVLPYQFIKARDDEDGAEPFVRAAKWAEEQEEQGLRPVGVPDWARAVWNYTPKSEAGKEIHRLAEHMLAGTAFQRRINHTSWHWYKYDLPYEYMAIVFSATAHLEGWHFNRLESGPSRSESLRVNYENVVARRHDWPDGVDTYHDRVMSDPDQRDVFFNYVVEKIGLFADGRTLVVCPLPFEKDLRRRLPDAVNVTHWGCDVGSNEYRNCSNVWLVSLFHVPKDVLFSKYLGHSKALATAETLEPGKNTQSSLMQELKRLHYKTHIKQMAARGTCRKVDGDGVADAMTLNCIFPKRDQFLDLLPELFHGIQLQDAGGGKVMKTSGRQSRKAKITEYLKSTDKDFVRVADLKGIRLGKKEDKELMEKLADHWASLGWVWERGKRGGSSSGFRRVN